MLVLEGLVGLHRTIQFQLLQHYWLDYCDTEWFALEMNRDHSVIFEIASKYCILDTFMTMMATAFLLRDSCPTSSLQISAQSCLRDGQEAIVYILKNKNKQKQTSEVMEAG